MAELDQEALRAVQDFEDADDDELYRELGLRVSALERNPEIAAQFAPPRELLEPKGMALGDMIQVGRAAFSKISKAGYSLICSGMQGGKFDDFIASLGSNRVAATAMLSGILMTNLGIAAVLAPMVAALVIGKIMPPTVEALCSGWARKAGMAEAQPAAPSA